MDAVKGIVCLLVSRCVCVCVTQLIRSCHMDQWAQDAIFCRLSCQNCDTSLVNRFFGWLTFTDGCVLVLSPSAVLDIHQGNCAVTSCQLTAYYYYMEFSELRYWQSVNPKPLLVAESVRICNRRLANNRSSVWNLPTGQLCLGPQQCKVNTVTHRHRHRHSLTLTGNGNASPTLSVTEVSWSHQVMIVIVTVIIIVTNSN